MPFDNVLMRRRGFLAGGGAAALAAMLPRAVLADAPTDKRLVVIVLRGAMDGLNVVVPYGDPHYAPLRGQIALARPGEPDGVIDLDGFFGLHPALDAVAPWYKEGGLLPIHAVASPYRDRSHFDGQDVLENGMITPHAANSGWLNRAIAAMGGGDRRIGLAVGQTIPLVLRGATAVASWAPTKIPAADPGFLSLVQTVYQGDPLLSAALAGGIAANQAADRAFGGDPEAMDGGAGGAAAYKGQRILADAAGRMLADPAGPRIAALDAYGWDTHAGQGAAKGRLAGALGGLVVSLTQLRQSLGPVWKDTIVVMATEFGRTVRVNGTGGTDHGSGGAMLLAGGGVAGGKVIAKWPGLSEAALYQDRDLAPTTDLRAVLKAVLREHMRIPADRLEATIFPNSADARPIAGIAAA